MKSFISKFWWLLLVAAFFAPLWAGIVIACLVIWAGHGTAVETIAIVAGLILIAICVWLYSTTGSLSNSILDSTNLDSTNTAE